MNIHSFNHRHRIMSHHFPINGDHAKHLYERIADTVFDFIMPILAKVPFFQQAIDILFQPSHPFTFTFENPYSKGQVNQIWNRFKTANASCIEKGKTLAPNITKEKGEQLLDFSTQIFLRLPLGWTIESLRDNLLIFNRLRDYFNNFKTSIPLNQSKNILKTFNDVLNNADELQRSMYAKLFVLYLDSAFKYDRTVLSKYLEMIEPFLSMPEYPFNALTQKIEMLLKEIGLFITHLKNDFPEFQAERLELDALNQVFETFYTTLKGYVTQITLALEVSFIENGVLPKWESSLFKRMSKQAILIKHLTKELFFLNVQYTSFHTDHPAQSAVDDYIQSAIDELYGIVVIWKNLNKGKTLFTHLPLINKELDKSFDIAFKHIQNIERDDMAILLCIIHLWMKRQLEWIEITEQFQSSIYERLSNITTFTENAEIDSLNTCIKEFGNRICNETIIDGSIEKNIILLFFPKKIKREGLKICKKAFQLYTFGPNAYEQCKYIDLISLDSIPYWRQQEIVRTVNEEARERAQECIAMIDEAEITTQDNEKDSPLKKISIPFLYGLILTPTIHFLIHLARMQLPLFDMWYASNNNGNQSDIGQFPLTK